MTNELKTLIYYIIKETHFGGTNGGLSEGECKFVHDKLVKGMRFLEPDINPTEDELDCAVDIINKWLKEQRND